MVQASIPFHRINCDLCCYFPYTHFTKFVTEIMLLKANFTLFLDKWVETTKEECFTQQQKVFVSVFSISFSLAGYLVFNSVIPLRVRLRSYTNYRHSRVNAFYVMP